MIDSDDLRAAVRAGLLSEVQAANLTSLADSRRGARENLRAGDEPFELFRGFNEIFIVMGLVILASGWAGVCAFLLGDGIGSLAARAATLGALSAAVVWLLSEYFILRRRMIAPAITLSIMFAGTLLATFGWLMGQPVQIALGNYTSLPMPILCATGAMVVYWWRFRVPLAAAVIALMLFAASIIAAATQAGAPGGLRDLFLFSSGGPFAWITLGLGLVTFSIAMWFDMSDPHRVTRRSASGFWLHVVAAPMLVNTLALSLLDAGSNLILGLVLAVFAGIAMVIDRRSFLMAALGYVITLASSLFDTSDAVYFVLALGITLLLLGAFWERIRAHLLALLAPVLPLDRLPPAVKETR